MERIVTAILAAAIAIPVGCFFIMNRRDPAGSRRRFRRTLAVNAVSFFGALIVGSALMLSTAYAEGAAAADTSWYGTACLAAALATGASCVGAGIAVSAAASAALGALSENEGIMGKAMIFVALAEGVAIYGLIISIMILGKVV